jgi:membrane dipeptidase
VRTRHLFTVSALLFTPLLLFAQQPSHRVSQADVDKITREAILIDTHDDVTSRTVDGYDITTPNKQGQTDPRPHERLPGR